jgi:hypothetical protein
MGLASVSGLRATEAPPVFGLSETEATLELYFGDLKFLTYHKADVSPPEGADPAFVRSGFIHPLKTPSGATLTGIHPGDHYHHLGLWHAWVKCEVDGREVDFWNLKKRLGRIRFGKTLESWSRADQAGFAVEQEHVAYLEGPDREPTVILRETFRVNARRVGEAFEIDYDTEQTNVSPHALKLPAYRYGGPIAYRAPHHWDRENSDYLGSEGTTRVDGHATRSRWCAFWGPGDDDRTVSLAILGHPSNHDAPQRMRVWPPNSHNGAIFFNYVPIQERGWEIAPGESVPMRYRLVAQDQRSVAEDLEKRWKRYGDES